MESRLCQVLLTLSSNYLYYSLFITMLIIPIRKIMLLVIYSNPHLNSKDEKQEAIVCVVTYCDHTHNLQVL